jgi:hypothetical protein
MKTVEIFLADVAESRRRAQNAERASFAGPPDLAIPPALAVALRHRFLVSPVLARSANALRSAYVGIPSAEREQIEYWIAAYGNEINWALQTGEHSVVALDVEDLRAATHSLAALAGDDSSWQYSLQFAMRNRWFLLFAHAPNLRSLVEFAGLRLHKRDSILLPPSRIAGLEITYSDPGAPLLPAPAWMRDRSI